MRERASGESKLRGRRAVELVLTVAGTLLLYGVWRRHRARPAMSSSSRPALVVVLGYSGRRDGLHEICAARLRRAETEAETDDVVLLSGWSRARRRPARRS